MLQRDSGVADVVPVEDGDTHAAIWSDTLRPGTATELREQVLAPDATPQSATTLRRDEQDSAVGSAPPHYLDALHLAAEHIADPQLVASLDQSGDLLLNGLTGEPGWPTLRGHLLLLAPPAPIRSLNCSRGCPAAGRPWKGAAIAGPARSHHGWPCQLQPAPP